MNIVTQKEKKNKRYLPHELTTREYSVRLYRLTKDIALVCRRYHISKASLMRWNKQYNGSRDSLEDKSHRPHSQHPSAHTEEELTWIRNYHRRNPNISICELYGKLCQEKAYSRHPGSLYRVFIRLGYRKQVESTKKKYKHNGHYDTPTELGIKWQMDVKYVPIVCYVGTDGEKFYQYTMIEEASRKRFIYAYKENSSYSTVDFVQRAIVFFGYAPDTIQTDHGGEFTHTANTTRTHPLDHLCSSLHIKHKVLRTRTPWHNGKVERSHRNDQERFYNYLRFYSFDDLQTQMKRYLRRANNIPMAVLGWMSPSQKQLELESARFC